MKERIKFLTCQGKVIPFITIPSSTGVKKGSFDGRESCFPENKLNNVHKVRVKSVTIALMSEPQ